MKPRIETQNKQLLVGMCIEMSFVDNKTVEIWKAFRSRIKDLQNRTSEDFISLQVYPKGYFDVFNPAATYVKWACVAVSNAEAIPVEMRSLILPKGLYAIFYHKGVDTGIFQYIYGEWLPQSEYDLDDRPHFEVLGPNYKNNETNAEEEIWIPIKTK